MKREEAWGLLNKYLKIKNLIKHCLACEVTMKVLYKRLNQDYADNPAEEEQWGITGLLHDADYEIAQETNNLQNHGLILFEKEQDTIPVEITHAIKSHNFQNTHVQPESAMDWAITCCDQLTGLIVAATLVRPDRKIASLTVDSVIKRMEEKSFARGANREMIKMCEEKLGIPLKEFVEITLKAMQGIAVELGL